MVLCDMRDRTRGRRCQTVLDGFSGQGTVTTQKHEGLMSPIVKDTEQMRTSLIGYFNALKVSGADTASRGDI